MTLLQAWLSKPRATVRIDTHVPWVAWVKALRRPFSSRQTSSRPRIEVLDRLSLGGKKSLLLVTIEGRRLLIGVGETTAPSISTFDEVRRIGPSRSPVRATRSRGVLR